MKRISLFIAFILMVFLFFTACGNNDGDVSDPVSEGISEDVSAVPVTVEVKAHGIKLAVPQDYAVTQGETVMIVTPEGKDNITVVSAAGSLDDFTQKNMTAALQTEFDFEFFSSYEKTEVNGLKAIAYTFEPEIDGVTLYIKQLNVQAGENVVTVTYCLTDISGKEEFESILQTVALE
ncbi:MAG: hypothetical protein IJK33_09540 [Clostridia bacterium]|nr:hypothetical protein [Clostridia bacterium]